MKGRQPELVVNTSDDEFHPPTSDTPSWIETMWFPCWIPEQGITISCRVWFSANKNVKGGAISAWRGKSEVLFGDRWTEAMEGEPDLTDVVAQNGLRIRRIKPLEVFEITYQGNNARLSLIFAAVMEPNPVHPSESPGMFAGHFEQPGKVTGSLELGDKKYVIDCYAIRDRSWGPREMPEKLRLGNAYGANEDLAFFTYIQPDSAGEEKIVGGYFKMSGEAARIEQGYRKICWKNNLPERVSLEAVDALGRSLTAEGECINVMASNAGNGVYGILNLVKWSVCESIAWGENHDIWSETDWLADGRAKLP